MSWDAQQVKCLHTPEDLIGPHALQAKTKLQTYPLTSTRLTTNMLYSDIHICTYSTHHTHTYMPIYHNHTHTYMHIHHTHTHIPHVHIHPYTYTHNKLIHTTHTHTTYTQHTHTHHTLIFWVWLHSLICISSVVLFSYKCPNFILHNDLKSCHVSSPHFISSSIGRLVPESSYSNPNKSCYVAQASFIIMILLSYPPEIICVHYKIWQEINFNDTFSKTYTK